MVHLEVVSSGKSLFYLFHSASGGTCHVSFDELTALSTKSSRDGKIEIAHVLEGPEGMEATLGAKAGLVARLKAIIDVRLQTIPT